MVNDQLDAQFFSVYLSQFSTCFEHLGSRVLQKVGNYHQTTRRHIPEDCNLHAHPHGGLKLLISHNSSFYYDGYGNHIKNS